MDSVSMVTEEHSLFLVRLNLRSSNFLSFAGTPKFMKATNKVEEPKKTDKVISGKHPQ